ncbi:MAG: hypothetical protein KDJ97_15920 [Anaerolineae bacterium]|nr:hypothetical protein [Anaerolineae bacterium]
MKVTWSDIFKYFFIVLTGLGVGLLVGLSISPVVSIVITSVTGSAAAIIAAMSGLENKPKSDNDDNVQSNSSLRWTVNPIPLAILVIGVVIGAGFGIYVRNQDLLGGTNVSSEIKQWTDAGLDQQEVTRRLFENRYSYRGWLGTDSDLSAEVEKWTKAGLSDEEEISRRLFESTYPLEPILTTNEAGTTSDDMTDRSVLFTSAGTTECDKLYKALARSNEKLVVELEKIEDLRNLPNIVTDPQTLERLITEVICPLE